MSRLLFLPDDLSQPWSLFDGEQVAMADAKTLSGQTLIVILSGQSIRILPHNLPNLRQRQREQAARFAVEPDIGEDVDHLHIVTGDTHLAVIGRTRMAAVIDALDHHGVSASAIYADFDVLPPATLTDRIVLKTATLDHGFPLDQAAPPHMELADAARRTRFDGAIDLQSGAFARRRMGDLSAYQSWMKGAGVLAASLLISGMLLHSAQSRAEQLQIDDLRARASAAYIQATGEASSNPARDVARLESPDEDPGALDLMAVLFAALKEVEGVSVEQLRYDEATGDLNLRLAYPGFGATQDLEAAVSRAGGRLQAGGVRETSGRFIGDARLRVES